jgi:phage terminase large subunit-like protein
LKPADPVTAYARQVVAGKVPSTRYHRLACKRHLDDLKRFQTIPYDLEDPRREKWKPKTDYYWDLYWCLKKLSFFPQLVHWRGQLAGQPFELMPWQMFVAGSLLGWSKRDGTYRYETAYISVPKKSGKSVFVGGLGLLRGFFDDEPGAETYSLATTYKQSDIVWREAAELAKRSKDQLVQKLNISTTRPGGVHNINDNRTSSKFEPLSSDKDSGDGVNPCVILADEIHRYKDAALLNMLQESMSSRRNRLTVEITTAGWDRNTICYEHDEHSKKVLVSTVVDEAWFVFICRADPEDRDRWNQLDVWKKSNPSWGITIREDRVRTAAKQAAELPSKLNDFLRYRLNIWTEQTKRAIDIDRWIASGENSPSLDALRGERCFAGLDLASNRDLCALLVIFPFLADGEVAVIQWLWCPEKGIERRSMEDRAPYTQFVESNLMKATDSDTTNYNVIRVDSLAILEHFELVALAFDPHNSGNLPHELAEVLGEKRVVKFDQRFGSMAAPVKEIERLYMEGKLKHGNNQALNWMANNTAYRTNEFGERRYDKEKSSEKIDGMVALAMAVGAWLNYEIQEAQESVYDRENRSIEIIQCR